MLKNYPQTYNRFFDIQKLILSMNLISNFDEARKSGISEEVIDEQKKKNIETTLIAVKYIAEESKKLGLELTKSLK